MAGIGWGQTLVLKEKSGLNGKSCAPQFRLFELCKKQVQSIG